MLTVNSVTHATENKLRVSLSNGKTRIFDLTNYINKGFFKELADENYLKLVNVDSSGMGIFWPNEQDFSADTLEAELII